MHKVKKDFIP